LRGQKETEIELRTAGDKSDLERTEGNRNRTEDTSRQKWA
jgi:hypothetical protein